MTRVTWKVKNFREPSASVRYRKHKLLTDSTLMSKVSKQVENIQVGVKVFIPTISNTNSEITIQKEEL